MAKGISEPVQPPAELPRPATSGPSGRRNGSEAAPAFGRAGSLLEYKLGSIELFGHGISKTPTAIGRNYDGYRIVWTMDAGFHYKMFETDGGGVRVRNRLTDKDPGLDMKTMRENIAIFMQEVQQDAEGRP